MVLAPSPISLEEYLRWDDGADGVFELVNGNLVPMPPESDQNQQIGISLIAYFLQLGISKKLIRNQTAITVASGRATARIPDLMILSETLAQELRASGQGTILSEMSPPRLVVETVSPGQEDRDYRYKRSEYAVCQIPEYWIVDPLADRVTVLELVAGFYEEQVYVGEALILSPQLGQLQLSAQAILAG
jgi:Uma2 family endonuclease